MTHAGSPAFDPFDLAVVVRFVFAHVKPLAVIVRRPPTRIGIDLHEPRVVPLAVFCQGVLPHLLQNIQIIGELVSLDALSRRRAQTRRRVPIAPFFALESVNLIKPFNCGEVEEQRPDGIGFRIVEIIELRHGDTLHGCKITPRIQFNIETSVPICGEYPSRGPSIFGPWSGRI